MSKFSKSTNEKKLYDVITPQGHTISFGNHKGHYRDHTGLNIYTYLDHNDAKKRLKYLKKANLKRNSDNVLSCLDPETVIFYEVNYLY
jgi:hypothetical protein